MPEPSDEPPTSPTYSKREVLATIPFSTGNKPYMVEVIRYTWRPDVAEAAGYPTCIRIRRRYRYYEDGVVKAESAGVPEKDWTALLEALTKVKI